MGLTERHWFENEDVPENYEWALEDAVHDSRATEKVGEVGMTDREKVIKELMKLHGSKETMTIIFDAITLLKEQEPVSPRWTHPEVGTNVLMCGGCGVTIPLGKPNYCPWCGKPVKWE